MRAVILAGGLGTRLRAAAQVGVQRGAFARRFNGTLLGLCRTLRLGPKGVLGRDACLQFRRGGRLGGRELLGGAPPALLGGEACSELSGRAGLRLL